MMQGNARVVIEKRDYARDVAVWIIRDGSQPTIARPVRDGMVWVERDENAIPEPSFVLKTELFELLIKAGAGHVTASDATTTHLNDAISVRDRLLALVERGAAA